MSNTNNNGFRVVATGQEFALFFPAVKAAQPLRSGVVEIATGLVRWTPAPPVSVKRMRAYEDRVAAYEARKRASAQ